MKSMVHFACRASSVTVNLIIYISPTCTYSIRPVYPSFVLIESRETYMRPLKPAIPCLSK